MKNSITRRIVPVALLAATGLAHADLTLEHSGSVSVGKFKQPLLRFKIFNNMTATRSRMMMKYDASNAMQMMPKGGMTGGPSAPMAAFGSPFLPNVLAFAPPGEAMPNPFLGTVTLVQRFDDDQVIGYTSLTNKYIGESFKDILKTTRFDPFKTLAPKLSENEPPSFTPEQRKRLGAEVRAALSPFVGKVVKIYFRPLSEKKTIQGLEGQGYRMTVLVNGGNPFMNENKWARMAFEWWVASDLAGDDEVVKLREAAFKLVGAERKNTTSIWFNEYPRVLFEMLPDEFHQAIATMLPRMDATPADADFKHVATPLSMTMTMTMPPGMGDQMGDIKMELNLTRRSVEALPAKLFDAPEGFKKVPWADVQKMIDDISKSARPPMPPMEAMPPMPSAEPVPPKPKMSPAGK